MLNKRIADLENLPTAETMGDEPDEPEVADEGEGQILVEEEVKEKYEEDLDDEESFLQFNRPGRWNRMSIGANQEVSETEKEEEE